MVDFLRGGGWHSIIECRAQSTVTQKDAIKPRLFTLDRGATRHR